MKTASSFNSRNENSIRIIIRDSKVEKTVEVKFKKLGAQIESLKRSIIMFKSFIFFLENLARQSLEFGFNDIFYAIFKNLYEKNDSTLELKRNFKSLVLTSKKHLSNLEKFYNNLNHSRDLKQFLKFYSDIQVKAEAMERKRNECLNDQAEFKDLKQKLETMKKEGNQLVNYAENINNLEKLIADKIQSTLEKAKRYQERYVNSYINAKNLLTDEFYYNLKKDYLKEFFDSMPSENNPFDIPYLEYNIGEMINCHVNDDIQDGELSLDQLIACIKTEL